MQGNLIIFSLTQYLVWICHNLLGSEGNFQFATANSTTMHLRTNVNPTSLILIWR